MDIKDLTIKKVQEGLKGKEFSAKELTDEYLKRIREKDGDIGAYLSVFEERALKAAGDIDERNAAGESLPPLAGVPVALKDNLLIEGAVATSASKILEHYVASYDSTAVRKIEEAGAVVLGKTNMDEFAMGASTENSGFHPTKNPHDPERVPGGSSGGSAAAVAGGMALGAFGSDTGGSIRQPAAFCGIVGFKPTYGAVSRSGLMAMSSSLDQIGPFARTVADAELLFDAIRGHDDLDSTSLDLPELEPLKKEDLRGLRIGLPKEYFGDGVSAAVAKGVEEAVEKLKRLGVDFKDISLPHAKYGISTYYIVMPAEVSSNLARFDGVRYPGLPEVEKNAETLRDLYFKTRGEGFGAEVRRRILLGTFVLSAGYYDAYYAKAQKVRRLIGQDFDNAWGGVDIIMTPVTPTPAFKFGEKTDDPLSMYLADIFTVSANLSGVPALSMPVKPYPLGGKELPVGFQLMGPRLSDKKLLHIGKFYEEE
ncbi:Asp-tRNA(Asn)/Glu-tRNA(Gln) amidotransferase subunit GatA [Patescibacteria group bacterium]|nr:Asp-tRNA(Asn)/Glu-tRNA(Gln) amidotransferase subunit GatA [Patescibacteria group bacterium]